MYVRTCSPIGIPSFTTEKEETYIQEPSQFLEFYIYKYILVVYKLILFMLAPVY